MIGPVNATWLLRFDTTGDGPRIAVKDCIDVAGTPTTVGCRAIAEDAEPATQDAPVVVHARRQGARIVGKTNLVELCRHADGINPWTGTPANPLDPTRIPGGSSSGSAVAVAVDEADVGYGTDTGGSVRVPAACCGIVGLKTTAGRIPTHGVFEFSRTLDTVGPLARDVAGAVVGMRMLEPGFTPAGRDGVPLTAARIRLPGVDPSIDAAVDRALAAAGFVSTDVELPDWSTWLQAAYDLAGAEGHWAHRHLLDRADRLEERNATDIRNDSGIPAARVVACRRIGRAATARLDGILAAHSVLALPTMAVEPPRLGERAGKTYLTVPFNLTGLPALALPVPRADGALPASLQLVGAAYAEEELLALGAQVEAALVSEP
ncbi:amidase [Actinopolymorpha alba]|uniref:amidase n=1 Tax=Actinopolymorpha alba TaxID=533267 RepID=UPI00037F09E6|nr:amidase [Actinopolymorpha alba]